MKKAITLIAFLAFIWACKTDDPCETVNCNKKGICHNGKCFCDVGFEGADCSKRWTDPLIGTWSAEIDCIQDTSKLVKVEKKFALNIEQIDERNIRLTKFIGSNIPLELELIEKETFAPIFVFSTAANIKLVGTAKMVNANSILVDYKETNFTTGKRFECVTVITR